MPDNPTIRIGPEVTAVFDTYPAEMADRLLILRQLILDTADAIGITDMEETLKWGEPSYVTKKGSTVRIAWKPAHPDQYSIFFKCTADLAPAFKARYPDTFTYGGNRSIDFAIHDKVPTDALTRCIAMALTYHLNKKLEPAARWEMVETMIGAS